MGLGGRPGTGVQGGQSWESGHRLLGLGVLICKWLSRGGLKASDLGDLVLPQDALRHPGACVLREEELFIPGLNLQAECTFLDGSRPSFQPLGPAGTGQGLLAGLALSVLYPSTGLQIPKLYLGESQFSSSPREGGMGTRKERWPGHLAEGAASPAFPEALVASSYPETKAAQIQFDLGNAQMPPAGPFGAQRGCSERAL